MIGPAFRWKKTHGSAKAKDMGLSPMLRIWRAPLQFEGCDCWPNWFRSGTAGQWYHIGTAFTFQWFQCFEVQRVSSHFAIMTRHSCLLLHCFHLKVVHHQEILGWLLVVVLTWNMIQKCQNQLIFCTLAPPCRIHWMLYFIRFAEKLSYATRNDSEAFLVGPFGDKIWLFGIMDKMWKFVHFKDYRNYSELKQKSHQPSIKHQPSQSNDNPSIWSNYSDLTRPISTQKVAFWKGNPRLFQGNPGWWNIII